MSSDKTSRSEDAQPLVSVITPVHNTPAKYLKACIASIVSQTLPDFELLLVDDGSDGATKKMLDEIAQQDKRIKVFHRPHGGVSAARNYGLDTCKGEFVTFVDADDVIESIFLDHAVRALKENHADVVFGVLAHQNRGKKVFPPGTRNGQTKVLEEKDLDDFLRFSIVGKPVNSHIESEYFYIRPHPVAPRVYSSQLVKNLRFSLHMTLAEDGLFTCMALQSASRLVLVNEIWYWYVMHNGSATHEEILKKVVEQFSSFNEFAQVGENHCWHQTDLGMRFAIEIQYRFRGGAAHFTSAQLKWLFNKLFALKSAKFIKAIQLNQYSLSAKSRLFFGLLKGQHTNLLVILLKIASLPELFKRGRNR